MGEQVLMDLAVGEVHTAGSAVARPLEDHAAVVRRITGAEEPVSHADKRKARIEARKKRSGANAAAPPAKSAERDHGPNSDRRKRVPKSIHIRADLAPGGALHVRHMADGETSVYLPVMPLSVD